MSKLQESQEIYKQAATDYPPHAVVLMLSGGKDSLATAEVARSLGIHVDYVLHGITRTGIQDTLNFVRSVASRYAPNYIEADAGDACMRDTTQSKLCAHHAWCNKKSVANIATDFLCLVRTSII